MTARFIRRSLRIAAGDLLHEPVEAVEERGSRQEHVWAMARDHVDAVGGTVGDRGRADRAGAAARAAMHPDMGHAGVDAVVDDLLRGLGRRHDDDALDGRLDVLDAGVAALAIDLRGVRVHRDGLVASLAKLLPDRVREVLRIARDADDGKALQGPEIVDLPPGRDHVRLHSSDGLFRPGMVRRRTRTAPVLNGPRPIDRRNVDDPRVSTRKGGLTRTVAARLPQLVLERLPVLDGVRLERTS